MPEDIAEQATEDDEEREIWRFGGFRCLYHPESGFWWQSGRYDDAGQLVDWGEATVSQTRLLLDAIANWFLGEQRGGEPVEVADQAELSPPWEYMKGDA